MSKYKAEKILYKEQDKLMMMFCRILSKLKNQNKIFDFLKDLLNRQERVMLVRRILIAKMLLEKSTYQEIMDKLKCAPNTIARVERWLNFGRDGYKKAISVLKI